MISSALDNAEDAINTATSTTEKVVSWLLGAPLLILLTIVLAVVVRALLHRMIDQFVARSVKSSEKLRKEEVGRGERVIAAATGAAKERHRQRTETLGSLLRSISTLVISGIAIVTVMGIVGIPLAPLLASAGVGGVALGFGAQSLVKDFLSGIFMILEDQYGVGDIVDTGEAIGTVEEVTLRVTRLRDVTGTVWYVRNGEIIRIANRSQGWATASVDIPFSYREDVDKVLGIIRTAVHEMDEDDAWHDKLMEEPRVMGVESITGGTVTVKILARCAPDEHWGVQREIRRRVKDAFDREGVAGPPIPPIAATTDRP
ncbi:mechanosensitive ion channel family protein [Janibacter sp. GXQ6167]|uniref:mechanosensitive ion channel family protein n=1 Tax=Janibacter sp. GXQ6167 TaxID=3240791 RepID=UPI00352321CE